VFVCLLLEYELDKVTKSVMSVIVVCVTVVFTLAICMLVSALPYIHCVPKSISDIIDCNHSSSHLTQHLFLHYLGKLEQAKYCIFIQSVLMIFGSNILQEAVSGIFVPKIIKS